METTEINPKTILYFIIITILISLCFRNCNDKSKFEIENNKYAKSNDSLNILFQKSVLEVERYERDLKKLNEELLIAQNNSQVSETKYYALKNKTIKPKYIDNVVDCNDTIQSIYKYAVSKDSLCNIVITDKNIVIKQQDTIIKTNLSEKKELVEMIDLKENANKNLESIISNDKKEIKQEKNKKNIWKTTSVGLALVVLKMIIFK